MINTKTFNVKVEWLEKTGAFFIYTVDENGYGLAVEEWKNQLFVWHESSYYGTLLSEKVNNFHEGVVLEPWQALDFFSKRPYSKLLTLRWSPLAEQLFSHTPIIIEEIENGRFLPSYESWRNGQIGWRLLTDLPLMDDFYHDMVSVAIKQMIESDPQLLAKWQDILSHYPLLTSQSTLSIYDEEDWLEKIGWKQNDVPFTIGLRLSEPEEGELAWKLNTFLRDKSNPSDMINWSPDQSITVPPEWQPSLHIIQREIFRWLEFAPLLKSADQRLQSELSEAQAWEFLTNTSIKLTNIGVEVLLPIWWEEIKETSPKLKVKVKKDYLFNSRSYVGINALIDFDWKVATDDIELSEEEFLQLVDQNRHLINVGGKWLKLDPSFIKWVKTIMKQVNKDGLSLRQIIEHQLLSSDEVMKKEQADVEEDLYAELQMELNKPLTSLIEQLSTVTSIPQREIPKNLQADLRPYQKQGVDWLLFLRQFGLGACLADDMGLGKTVQMIAYFLYAKDTEKHHNPALIICPTSVLGNWQKELEKFAPSLKVYLHYGSARKKGTEFSQAIDQPDIILTSYSLVNNDIEELKTITWSSICLDEAQMIKNAYTKQAKAVRALSGHHKIALTGTPIENRLTELWSIFDFINKGYLGSLSGFRQRFVQPIEKDSDQKRITQIQQLIRPFLLRRTKKDKAVSLNLPEKQEQKEYCPLTTEQASLYEQLVQDTIDQIEKVSGMKRRGLILTMLNKLKQLCNHPSLYLKEDNPKKLVARSLKLEKVIELVEAIRHQDESCLLFTQYIGMGKLLQNVLMEHFQEEATFLHGGIIKGKRDQMINNFQNGNKRLLILSLKAGGTGLNLTAANHVIHFDRWWNPAVENQATDRAYRIGQEKFVHVHKLITTGTIEEKIDDMLESKQKLSNEIIATEELITELSSKELRELFALRQTW